jgi:hypothetical protein
MFEVSAWAHCCRITLELRDRQTKVDVLHAKFEMLASRAHGTDADGGEPKSQAYYIVKVRARLAPLQMRLSTGTQRPVSAVAGSRSVWF